MRIELSVIKRLSTRPQQFLPAVLHRSSGCVATSLPPHIRASSQARHAPLLQLWPPYLCRATWRLPLLCLVHSWLAHVCSHLFDVSSHRRRPTNPRRTRARHQARVYEALRCTHVRTPLQRGAHCDLVRNVQRRCPIASHPRPRYDTYHSPHSAVRDLGTPSRREAEEQNGCLLHCTSQVSRQMLASWAIKWALCCTQE